MTLRTPTPTAASVFLSLVCALSLMRPGAARADYMLSFGANGPLPSAQGLTYFGSPNAPETTAYSVSGGLLHLNTVQFGGDVGAYYDVPGGYNSALDAEFKARLKVTQSTTSFYGVTFGFFDSVASQFLVVRPTGWSIYTTGTEGTFADPTAFHTFDLKTFAATNSYTLLIDDVVVATGARTGGIGLPTAPSSVYFGDGSATGGNQIADISFVQYTNSLAPPAPAPVPAPSALLTAPLVGLTAVGWLRARRRPAAAS